MKAYIGEGGAVPEQSFMNHVSHYIIIRQTLAQRWVMFESVGREGNLCLCPNWDL